MGEPRSPLVLFVVLLVSLFVASNQSCLFGGGRFHGVTSYRSGKVYLRHDRYYHVGELPKGWRRLGANAQVIAFYHPQYETSIFTAAFCREQFDDSPLTVVLGRMVGGLDGLTPRAEKKLMLDGREALEKHFSARLDGLPVEVDAVAIKKGHCLFDFAAISPPAADPQAAADFVTFYNGFAYQVEE